MKHRSDSCALIPVVFVYFNSFSSLKFFEVQFFQEVRMFTSFDYCIELNANNY